jgi:soluble lytic murein transglycosylase-like protein
MTAVAGVAAVQARIGAIESRLGVDRVRQAQMGAVPVLTNQLGSSVAAMPLGYADVAAGAAAGMGSSTTGMTAADFGSVVRQVELGAAQAYGATVPTGTPGALGGVPGADQVNAATPHAALFNEAGARWGIPPTVLAGMAYVESRFQNDVVSQAGAVGMMQFLPSTAASMGVNPHDPNSAIDGAARYLRTALDRFGSLDMAIGAYNIGPGAMARAGAVNPGTQADRYVTAVRAAAGRMA